MAIDIEKRLGEAGYSLLGNHERIENLIIAILKTKNMRYLKAIPYIIYKHRIDISRLQIGKNELWEAIISITIKLFNEYNIQGILPQAIDEETNLTRYDKEIKKSGLSYDEFKEEFELQMRNESKPNLLLDKQKIYAERDLQLYLSKLFTKKEKMIIGRLLEDQPISKTDYEYYSRKTKKKIQSILGLHEFAQTLFNKNPKVDNELFKLKKKLELILKEHNNILELSLTSFFFWEPNKLSLMFKVPGKPTKQMLLVISEKDDPGLYALLKKYKKHKFNE